MKKILNQKGNISFVLLASFIFFGMLFFVIFSAGEVLVLKQKTSQAAEQASLVYTSVILEQARTGAMAHDELPVCDPPYPPYPPYCREYDQVLPKVGEVTYEEFKIKFDEVVTADLESGNWILGFHLLANINPSLAEAKAKDSVEKNGGDENSLDVQLNENSRVESTVTNSYWTFMFHWFEGKKEEKLVKSKKKHIPLNQNGEGPQLNFMKMLGL